MSQSASQSGKQLVKQSSGKRAGRQAGRNTQFGFFNRWASRRRLPSNRCRPPHPHPHPPPPLVNSEPIDVYMRQCSHNETSKHRRQSVGYTTIVKEIHITKMLVLNFNSASSKDRPWRDILQIIYTQNRRGANAAAPAVRNGYG